MRAPPVQPSMVERAGSLVGRAGSRLGALKDSGMEKLRSKPFAAENDPEYVGLRTALDHAKRQREKATDQSDKNKWDNRAEQIANALKSKEELVASDTWFGASIDDIERVHDTRKQALEALTKKVKDIKAKIDPKEKKIKELRAVLKDLPKAVDDLEKKYQDVKDDEEASRDVRREAKKKFKAAQKDLQKKRDKLARLEEEVDVLEVQLDNEGEKEKQISDEVSELNDKIKREKSRKQEDEKKMDDRMKNILKFHDTEGAKLRASLGRAYTVGTQPYDAMWMSLAKSKDFLSKSVFDNVRELTAKSLEAGMTRDVVDAFHRKIFGEERLKDVERVAHAELDKTLREDKDSVLCMGSYRNLYACKFVAVPGGNTKSEDVLFAKYSKTNLHMGILSFPRKGPDGMAQMACYDSVDLVRHVIVSLREASGQRYTDDDLHRWGRADYERKARGKVRDPYFAEGSRNQFFSPRDVRVIVEWARAFRVLVETMERDDEESKPKQKMLAEASRMLKPCAISRIKADDMTTFEYAWKRVKKAAKKRLGVAAKVFQKLLSWTFGLKFLSLAVCLCLRSALVIKGSAEGAALVAVRYLVGEFLETVVLHIAALFDSIGTSMFASCQNVMWQVTLFLRNAGMMGSRVLEILPALCQVARAIAPATLKFAGRALQTSFYSAMGVGLGGLLVGVSVFASGGTALALLGAGATFNFLGEAGSSFSMLISDHVGWAFIFDFANNVYEAAAGWVRSAVVSPNRRMGFIGLLLNTFSMHVLCRMFFENHARAQRVCSKAADVVGALRISAAMLDTAVDIAVDFYDLLNCVMKGQCHEKSLLKNTACRQIMVRPSHEAALWNKASRREEEKGEFWWDKSRHDWAAKAQKRDDRL